MVDAFNASRLDLATLGNHEFDGSRTNLVARLAESKFQWLSGNCSEATGGPFPGVRGWDTVRINGVRVGIFGTTVVRDYPAYVRCRNADSATTALVESLMTPRILPRVSCANRHAQNATADTSNRNLIPEIFIWTP